MTITASLDAPDTFGSRRSAQRHKLKLVTGARGEGTQTLVEILDLSATGLLLKTAARLGVGSRIDVVLPNVGEAAATVRWAGGNFYGCQFNRALPQAALSAAQLRSDPLTQGEPDQALPDAVDGETLGKRLARLRKQMDLTLHHAAEALGVSKTTVWKWETDSARPRPAALARLALLYDRSEAELLFGRREQVPQPASTSQDAASLQQVLEESKGRIAQSAGIPAERISITISL